MSLRVQLGGAQCHTAPGSARRRLRLFFLGGIPGCISRARTRGNATCLVYLLEVLELGTGVDLMVVGVVPAMEGNGGANGERARNGRTMIIQWNPNPRAAGAGRRVWHLTGWDEGRDLTLSPAAAVTGPGGTTNQREGCEGAGERPNNRKRHARPAPTMSRIITPTIRSRTMTSSAPHRLAV